VKSLKTTLYCLVVIVLVLVFIVAVNYITLPTNTTTQTHFDTIVVLGTPTKTDGTPSAEQRERVLEGIREYRAGVAPRIIMTGAAAHNHFVEAHTMAQLAATQGVPASAILEEPQATNTIQNICYSAQLMHQHNWSSAEIVSSPNHLGRAALILKTFNLTQPALSVDWRTHPAHWPPEYSIGHEFIFYSVEAWRCLQLRITGFPSSKFLPRSAAAS
jgi:uncharacterized SAM-binding protein YcdF (DUF218 family)